jgi:uncharacterized membrane protein YeiH
MNVIPDLATQTPLWLALLTVGVNAVVGALRATIDDERHWDIVGVTTFGVLTGLGGGFIRDLLVGNLPVESLRTPWFLTTALAAIVLVLFVGERVVRIQVVVTLLNALALGLFAITGVAYALRAGLPVMSALFIGVASAVGGGVLVSVLKGEIPSILVTSAPNALVALLTSGVYAAVAVANSRLAGVVAIVAGIVAHYAAQWLGLRTRRADSPSALLFTREPRDS